MSNGARRYRLVPTKKKPIMDRMEEGECVELEEGECVPCLYDSKWADKVDRNGTRWGHVINK